MQFSCKKTKTIEKERPVATDAVIAKEKETLSIPMYTIAKTGLKVRSAPSADAKALGKLPYNSLVTIVENSGEKLTITDEGKKISGEWVAIKFSSYTILDAKDIIDSGYVFNGFLAEESPAEFAPIHWTSTFCDHKGIYDTNLYSKEELFNTHRFCFRFDEYIADNIRNPFDDDLPSPDWTDTAADFEKLTLDSLTVAYELKKKFLEEVDLIDGEFWEKERQKELNFLKARYQFIVTKIKAYRDPNILLNLDNSEASKIYVEKLTGGSEELIRFWKQMVIQNCENNGSPASCRQRWLAHLNDHNVESYAKIYLLTFGWGNNTKVLNRENHEELGEKFKQTLESYEEDCAETD